MKVIHPQKQNIISLILIRYFKNEICSQNTIQTKIAESEKFGFASITGSCDLLF